MIQLNPAPSSNTQQAPGAPPLSRLNTSLVAQPDAMIQLNPAPLMS